MSPNTQRTQTSETQTHTRRRRHAAPSDPTWVRRAGLVGGVVSALALCGAAAPAMAENPQPSTRSAADTAATSYAFAPLSTSATAQQASAAIDQEAIAAALAADQQKAAADATKAAAAEKAAHKKAAAKAKAARERAAAARSAARAKLAADSTSTSASASASTSASATPTATTTAATTSSGKAGQLIAFLKSQLGKPYVYGATGPGSYDCSGLTQAAFASIGVDIPRTSQEQSTAGTPVSVSDLQAGDLIFWGGEGSAYHVGVFIGNGQYLDAANPSTPVAIHQLADYMPDWAVNVL
jgi:peptidoglycan DL-endopeptidase CwlO